MPDDKLFELMRSPHLPKRLFEVPNFLALANIFDEQEIEAQINGALTDDNDPAGGRPKGPQPS